MNLLAPERERRYGNTGVVKKYPVALIQPLVR